MTIALLFSVLAVTLSACGGAVPAASSGSGDLKFAPESILPEVIRNNAAPQVKEAYRFAAANPDVLSKYPCYCGCGAMGHKSNLDCYVKQANADGSIVFDDHAYGCSICVDITQDVMRLMREGRAAREIRAYIDATYSRYGPGTDTQPVE